MANEQLPAAADGQSRTRVLLVDDHDGLRDVLSAVLRAASDVEIVGKARDGEEAIELANSLEPDVVLMDIAMPVMDGVEATHRIAREHPRMRIIAYSIHTEADLIQRMLRAGAAEHLCKDAPLTELLDAIRGEAN